VLPCVFRYVVFQPQALQDLLLLFFLELAGLPLSLTKIVEVMILSGGVVLVIDQKLLRTHSFRGLGLELRGECHCAGPNIHDLLRFDTRTVDQEAERVYDVAPELRVHEVVHVDDHDDADGTTSSERRSFLGHKHLF